MSRRRQPRVVRYMTTAQSAILQPAWAASAAAKLVGSPVQHDLHRRGAAIPLRNLDDVLAALETHRFRTEAVLELEAAKR